MAESLGDRPDETAGNGDNAGAAKSQDSNLPMVLAPKLGAGEEEVDEAADDAETAAPAAAPAHSARFVILAATVACTAAFASFVGSVSGSGLARYLSPAAPGSSVETTTEAMRQTKLELAELAAIKANLDTATRSTTSQFAKITDRLDRLDQRTASAASETTGSIAAAPPAAAPPPEAPKLTDRILQDWVVQDVQDGRALVESRYGGVFDVGAGSVLPGVGRVETVKREDGQWIVVTARGTITSGR